VPELETAQRQALPPVYHRNGALYAVRRDFLVAHRTVMAPRKKAYVMPRERLANIDDERDLAVADVLVRRWKDGTL
jgi:CMP-N-acetylneuraminic acid synthetase